MTHEEVLAMASEANLPACHTTHPKALERFAKLVRDDYSNKHAKLWLGRMDEAVKAERDPRTQPAAREPLTPEQIDEIFVQVVDAFERGEIEYESHGLARAIEAAHGITAPQQKDAT